MTTDYRAGDGCPQPYLERIAAAGFTHVHWCHQWATDFIYSDSEIDAIAGWMNEFDLGLTDLHASAGIEKDWGSPHEYARLAGVELVKNRLSMCRRLGSDVIIMHSPLAIQKVPEPPAAAWDSFFRSLDDLRPEAERMGMRIALENGDFHTLSHLEKVFGRYDRDFIGLCWDSGHGNKNYDGLDWLNKYRNRLASIHIHDNDGKSDQHNLPFTGTVNWEKLAFLFEFWVISSQSGSLWLSTC